VRHSKYLLFQLAEVAVPRQLFARILGRIARLCCRRPALPGDETHQREHARNHSETAARPSGRAQLVLPRPIQGWTLTTLREKLIKIGAKVVRHSKYLLFQLAEVAVPRQLFARILGRIARLCQACAWG
jgi:hypothetical protein